MEGKEERETRVLESFCSVSSEAGFSSEAGREEWIIDRYPDRKRTGASACDAILLRNGTEVAVEIEIVESNFGRKEDDARFLEVIHPVEAALRSAFPELDIIVIVPFQAVPTGMKWPIITEELSNHLVAGISAKPAEFVGELELTSVPFKVWVVKHPPLGTPIQTITRFAPHDQLFDVVQVRLDHAAAQLAQYKKAGMETIILLDSDDSALSSPTHFLACVAGARPSSVVDAVFLALSHHRPAQIYPLRIGNRVFPEILPDFIRFMGIQSRFGSVDEN